MEYLAKAEAFDIELSSDFIVMASELMLIKSRMLLPRNEEEEEDPRAALAAAVLEYQRAKEASAHARRSVFALRSPHGEGYRRNNGRQIFRGGS